MVGSPYLLQIQATIQANFNARANLCFHSYHRQGLRFYILEFYSPADARWCLWGHFATHTSLPSWAVPKHSVLSCFRCPDGHNTFCSSPMEIAFEGSWRLAIRNDNFAFCWCRLRCNDGAPNRQHCRIHEEDRCIFRALYRLLSR